MTLAHRILTDGLGVTVTDAGHIASFTPELGIAIALMAALLGVTITYLSLYLFPTGKLPVTAFLASVTTIIVVTTAWIAPLVFRYTQSQQTSALQAAILGLLLGVGTALTRWQPRTEPASEESLPAGDEVVESLRSDGSGAHQSGSNDDVRAGEEETNTILQQDTDTTDDQQPEVTDQDETADQSQNTHQTPDIVNQNPQKNAGE